MLCRLCRTFTSLPRQYAQVNSLKPVNEVDCEQLNIVWGRQDDYEVITKLGRGKYSEVFKGLNVITCDPVVIKILKPVRKKKIQRELKILQVLSGFPNIPEVVDMIKDEASKIPSLVLEYSENEDFRTLYPKLSDFDIRFYMYELIKTLDYTHSKGIMHRDVKPNNVMIDHSRRKLRLIDWGLAEFYFPDTDYQVRVASRYFKGPELLVNNPKYHYSLDMWSLGAMFAGIIFKKEPFFHGSDNLDQLVKIARVLGTNELSAYLLKYNLELTRELDEMLGYFPKKPWTKFITNFNHELASPEAIDLLSKLLKYDHNERILPSEALIHDYFIPVREMWSHIQLNTPIKPSAPCAETAQILVNSS